MFYAKRHRSVASKEWEPQWPFKDGETGLKGFASAMLVYRGLFRACNFIGILRGARSQPAEALAFSQGSGTSESKDWDLDGVAQEAVSTWLFRGLGNVTRLLALGLPCALSAI